MTKPKFTKPLTCDTCGAELPDLTHGTEWLMGQLQEIHEERDLYRGWFTRLLDVAWRGEPELREELQRLQSEVDARTVPAREAKRRAADEKAMRAMRLKQEGITASAIGLRMAREHGRPERPYDARQVRRWFNRDVESRTD